MGACRALKPFGKKRSNHRCHTYNICPTCTARQPQKPAGSVDRRTPPPTSHEAALGQGLSVNKESDMVGPMDTDVHEARTQPLLHKAEATAQTQRSLILGTHAHLDAVQAELADDEVED